MQNWAGLLMHSASRGLALHTTGKVFTDSQQLAKKQLLLINFIITVLGKRYGEKVEACSSLCT